MTRELGWVCGIVPPTVNKEITMLCKLLNADIFLPENVFKFPLHISLKKSFHCQDFEALRCDVAQLIQQMGPIRCEVGEAVLHRQMIWLPIANTGDIKQVHEALDHMLLDKYGVPIDKFDARFQPHISLFTSGDQERINCMFHLMQQETFAQSMQIRRFVIGSSAHKDVFYDV